MSGRPDRPARTGLRPEDVRFVDIRDWPWPQKWCATCGRKVPVFHQHYKKDKRKGERGGLPTDDLNGYWPKPQGS